MLGTAKQTYDYLTCGVGCPTDLESHALAVVWRRKGGSGKRRVCTSWHKLRNYSLLRLKRWQGWRRCDVVKEQQHVLLRLAYSRYWDRLREKCYSLVTSSHRISPRDLNSYQPVGRTLGLSRNSVSKLGTVRSTVVQRIDNESCVRCGTTASRLQKARYRLIGIKCHKFVNFYNNGLSCKYENIHHVKNYVNM